MIHMINRLTKHRLFNSILVITYFLLVVLPHKRFGTWINRLFGKNGFGLTRNEYNEVIAMTALTVFGIMAVGLFFLLKKHPEWKKVIFYLLSSLIFAIIIVNVLFVINIEMVHFPQYAAFAILIFAFTNRYFSTLVWTTIAGSIDEAYQYFYLAPNDTGYYDFNDVVTNLIGATFGLIILKAFQVKEKETPPLLQRSEVIGVIILIVTIAILYITKVWCIHPEDGGMYPIIKKKITTFWTTLPPKETFHVMKPWEGIVAVLALFGFYSRLK